MTMENKTVEIVRPSVEWLAKEFSKNIRNGGIDPANDDTVDCMCEAWVSLTAKGLFDYPEDWSEEQCDAQRVADVTLTEAAAALAEENDYWRNQEQAQDAPEEKVADQVSLLREILDEGLSARSLADQLLIQNMVEIVETLHGALVKSGKTTEEIESLFSWDGSWA